MINLNGHSTKSSTILRIPQMGRLTFLPALMMLYSACTYAQETSKTRQIGLGTGFNYEALKNESISPLAHSGSSVPTYLFFRAETERSRHHIQLNYFSSHLNSSAGGLTTTISSTYLQYAYHRKIGITWQSIDFHGGGVLGIQNSLRDNLRQGQTTGNNSASDLISSISPSLLMERKSGSGKISLQMWTAILGFVVQPGYAVSFPDEKNLLSINSFSQFESRLSYSRYLSPRLEGRLDGQFQFYSLTNHEPLRQLNLQALVALAYKF